MLSSDCVPNNESHADNLQQRCDNALTESGHKRIKLEFQNQETVGVNAGNLKETYNKENQYESVRNPITWNLQPGCAKTNPPESARTPICEEKNVNNSEPMSQNDSSHLPKHLRHIRYPDDIIDIQSMSRKELEDNVMLSKTKVEGQSKMIAALKRKDRAKNRQISRLRCLVEQLDACGF